MDFFVITGMLRAMTKKTTRNYIWVLAANALLILAVVALWEFRLHQAPKDPNAHYLPDVAYLSDLTNKASLTDLKGQWTLLNLWAAWCPSCVTEMPSLEKLANDYKSKGLHVVAISLDEAKSVDGVKANIAKFKFGPITHNWDDMGQVYAAMNPEGLPTTYLADPSGKIVHVFEGERDWSAQDARSVIDQSLDVNSGTTVNRSPTKP